MKAARQTKPVMAEPVVLEPYEDLATGQMMYDVPSETAWPARQAPGQVPPPVVTDRVLTPESRYE